MKLVIGISGASGAIYGIRLLEALQQLDGIETHLVISRAAEITITSETSYDLAQVTALASHMYAEDEIGARIASGSFRHDGMVVIPCSVKTFSAIAHSYNSNLLIRAADVALKERRRLVLVVRETPLNLSHLRALTGLTEAGAVILPPCPAFYHKPTTIADLVNHTVGKVLDQLGVEHALFRRWEGTADT
jgi:4-hydroxy-3-polyprenylbenzoate decarboxylase